MWYLWLNHIVCFDSFQFTRSISSSCCPNDIFRLCDCCVNSYNQIWNTSSLSNHSQNAPNDFAVSLPDRCTLIKNRHQVECKCYTTVGSWERTVCLHVYVWPSCCWIWSETNCVCCLQTLSSPPHS